MNQAPKTWCALETSIGEFRMYDMEDELVRVVCMGDITEQGDAPLLRMHSSCIASESFHALDCDCSDQLYQAMKLIKVAGKGLILHLHQEGRGHGLSKKILAVKRMQEDGLDTSEAFDALDLEQDIRSYEPVVSLLGALGISHVRLISNNPRKADFLKKHGIKVESVNLHPKLRPENRLYLKSKNAKLGHKIPLDSGNQPKDAIYFYHSDLPWGYLSNLSKHPVFLRGKIWPTVEHFYQAQKFAGTRLEETVRRCALPIQAKATATDHEKHRRADWEDVKEDVMTEALRAKFEQHIDLQEELLLSGDRQLVERAPDDHYWGDGGDDTGLNRLGQLLMQVRGEIRKRTEGKPKQG